jgi:hypothetical protein
LISRKRKEEKERKGEKRKVEKRRKGMVYGPLVLVMKRKLHGDGRLLFANQS